MLVAAGIGVQDLVNGKGILENREMEMFTLLLVQYDYLGYFLFQYVYSKLD